MEKRVLLSLVLLLAVSTLAPAATRLVPGDYNTIQDAINAAVDGDTVVVADGTYTGDGNRDIEVNGKSITIRSENGPESCIIDCNSMWNEYHRGFTVHNNQETNCSIDGFTIINGFSQDGIIYSQDSDLTISNCNIKGNTVFASRGGSGGGISVIDGIYMINNCTINNNSFFEGSGIACYNSDAAIINCNINSNMGSGRGGNAGGISVIDGIYLINNCTISNNSTEQFGSGGISCEGSTLTISNSSISENINGGIGCVGSTLTVHNCKIHGNSQRRFDFSSCGTGGIGCRDSDVIITNSIISDNSRNCGDGGIGCYDSNTTILNCSISGNAGEEGGGIHCTRGSSIISNCKISGNAGQEGGGIHCDEGSSIISNCKISGNAGGDGGGIHCTNGSSIISNCKISGNTARYFIPAGYEGYGGGIYCDGSSSTIKNCTFTGNLSSNGNSLACYSYGMRRPSNVELSNCILWDGGDEISKDDNSTITVSFSDVQGGWEGQGNIDADPCFVEAGFWDANGTPDIWYDDFWVEGDYHLRPESLCIDAGDPCYVPGANETDLDGLARVFGGRIDMGAYEFSYIEARLRVFPQVINRHSRMKRIMAWVHLPRDITKEQVDEDWPMLLYPGGIEPTRQYVFQHGRGRGKCTYVLAYYDKVELMEAVGENGTVELEVMGRLKSGQYFRGCDSVRIKGQRGRRWQYWFRR